MKRDAFRDITAPKAGVEVEVREDRNVIWIHVDGITVLRICRIPQLIITDNSEKKGDEK